MYDCTSACMYARARFTIVFLSVSSREIKPNHIDGTTNSTRSIWARDSTNAAYVPYGPYMFIRQVLKLTAFLEPLFVVILGALRPGS